MEPAGNPPLNTLHDPCQAGVLELYRKPCAERTGDNSGHSPFGMDSGKFTNPWPHESHGLRDILRWKCGLPPREQAMMPEASDAPAQSCPLDVSGIARPPETGWRAVWLGHASFLLQGAGVSLLIDPVFSSHCAPLPLPPLRRLVDPPLEPGALPPIDAVLLSHSHYDHLDLPTLKRLGKGTPLIVPAGHARWLARAGFRDVTEIPWFGTHALTRHVDITATPAQHFTARSLWDRNSGHWCGWLLHGAACSIWHAGDTGYCGVFKEIGMRFGPIDFGMIPIGAYQPRRIMRPFHLNPEEAVQVFLDSRCRRATAMHWGTFRLTDEPLGEPPLRLAAALARVGVPEDSFNAGKVGQLWTILPA